MLTQGGHNIRIANRLIILLFFYISGAGCSSSPSGTGSSTEDKEETSKPFDACSIVDKPILEKVLGEPIVSSNQAMSDPGSAKTAAISQCTFYSGTGSQMKYIGIVIQRNPGKNANPKSREDYMQEMNEGFQIGAEEEVKKAIAKGTAVPGLGDLAFTWNYLSYNLIVFWNGNYKTVISIYGREDNPATLEDAKMIAGKIMEKLK